MNLAPEIYTPLMVIFRLAHIFGAMIWFGFGLYNYFVVSRVDTNMSATAINYQLGVAKYTKFGEIMGAAAGSTALAGLLLWAINGSKYGTGAGVIILGIGSLFGLAAVGHGMGIGKRNGELSTAILAAENDGVVNPESYSVINAMIAKLNRSSNVSLGLMAVAFVCMVSYSQF